jgi:hypothetical protein
MGIESEREINQAYERGTSKSMQIHQVIISRFLYLCRDEYDLFHTGPIPSFFYVSETSDGGYESAIRIDLSSF